LISWYQEAINRLKKFEIENNFKVLDIGTGFGHFSFQLNKNYPELFINSIDLNSDNLKIAIENMPNKRIISYNWWLMDAAKTSFKNDVFDLVISAFSLQYWKKPIDILNEINRVLKTEGIFVLTDLRRDMSKPIIKKIAELSSANNPNASVEEIENFIKIRLKECYTPKEIIKMAKKSHLKNWRLTQRTYGFYLESLPK
jgi:ubiquinone/menaquinone biosynthesis C-methylase UbiE